MHIRTKLAAGVLALAATGSRLAKYAARSAISCSDSLSALGFITPAMGVLRSPFLNSLSCDSMSAASLPASGGKVPTPL